MAAFSSCNKKVPNPNTDLTLEYYSSMKRSGFQLNSHRVRAQIDSLISQDDDSTMADIRAKNYYRQRGPLLWVDRNGVDSRADTLLAYIDTIDHAGFNQERFCLSAIRRDLKALRTLSVGDGVRNINRTVARLEYHLTKSFFRYVSGQRFGYFNPRYALNHLDVLKSDSGQVTYQRLFDLKLQLPGPRFFAFALNQLAHDSLGVLLRSSQPQNPYFYRLEAMLAKTRSSESRARILCNMERARWRLDDTPREHEKYVVVNIPSYRLYAVNGKKVLTMRVGCGTTETKTPLLTSRIKRFELNPRWVIPQSIVKKSLLHRAGDIAYFRRRHFGVAERSTGKSIPLTSIQPYMLTSKDYYVYQKGGDGNSLGRIIFRFDNNFSVFLHYTSAPDVFARENRGVSHGCVRVEKPYELALFLLPKSDKALAYKIYYSLTANLSPLEDDFKATEESPDTLKRNQLINVVDVVPSVPLFISYYTLFPDVKNRLCAYDDVYGYDKVIYSHLKYFL